MVSRPEILGLFWWFKVDRDGLTVDEIAFRASVPSSEMLLLCGRLSEASEDGLLELTYSRELHPVIKSAEVTVRGLRAYAAHIQDEGGEPIQDGVYTITSPTGQAREVRVVTDEGDVRIRIVTVGDSNTLYQLRRSQQGRPYIVRPYHEPLPEIDGYSLSKSWHPNAQTLACFVDLVHRQTRSWFYGQGMRIEWSRDEPTETTP